MTGRIRRRLTFANVCSFIALTVAVGTGGAYAANTIGSADIIDESIQSVDVLNGQIKVNDLGGSAVTSAKIANSTVAADDLAADSVGSASVVNESLSASDLGTDSVNATEIADNSIDSGEIFPDSLQASDLAGSSVATSELQDAGINNADLAGNAVTGPKVAANSLTTADIAGADVNGGAINVPTGYVPNGRCRQLDANVGGAKSGEAVVFSIKAALQDGIVIYGQRVPSDGHVMFDVCNFSGTTQAAISSLPVRVITFG